MFTPEEESNGAGIMVPESDYANPYPLFMHPSIDILDSSKLQDYEKCRRYGMMSHLFGWRPDRMNNHLVFGSANHLAHAHLLLHGYSPQTVMKASLLLEEEYRKYFDAPSDDVFFPKIPWVALNGLIKYVKQYADEDAQYITLHVEVAGRVPLLNGIYLHFKLDSLRQHVETGLISSLEHKTGSKLSDAWRKQWNTKIQTGTYQHVEMCMYPQEQCEGIVINGMIYTSGIKKAGNVTFERVLIKRSPEMMNEWLYHTTDLAMEIIEGIRLVRENYDILRRQPVLRIFPKNTESCGGYSGCRFYDLCTAWSNPMAYADTCPSGFKVEFWDPRESEAHADNVISFQGEEAPSVTGYTITPKEKGGE